MRTITLAIVMVVAAVVCLAGAATPASADVITVTVQGYSFEFGSGDYMSGLGTGAYGWYGFNLVDNAYNANGLCTFISTGVSGVTGSRYAYTRPGMGFYQTIGTWTRGHVYTLTAALGVRSDYNGADILMAFASGNTVLALSPSINETTTMTNYSLTFAPGQDYTTGRIQFRDVSSYPGIDNVRLTDSRPTIGLAAANATIITGGTADVGAAVSDSGTAGTTLYYQLTGATVQPGSSVTLGSLPGAEYSIAQGATAASRTVTASSSQVGLNTVQFTVTGTNSPSNASANVLSTLTVLDHSNASLYDTTSDYTDALTIDFGSFALGAPEASRAFSLYNLVTTLGYTARLDFDTVQTVAGSSTLFSTNLGAGLFTNKVATEHADFTAFFNPTTAGTFSADYTLTLSDENLPGSELATPQTLTLHLTGTVVPEPATLAFLALGGVSMIGAAVRRRRPA